MQTLHAIGRPPTDRARVRKHVMRVASRDIVRVRGLEGRAEVFVAVEALIQFAHRATRLESTHFLAGTDAGEPVERGEWLTVDERMRFDDGGQTARASDRNAYIASNTAPKLTLDGAAIFVRKRKASAAQPSLFRTLRLMSAWRSLLRCMNFFSIRSNSGSCFGVGRCSVGSGS